MADPQRMITVGWQLRAYPTPDQEAKLTDWSTAGGYLWNDLVEWWRTGLDIGRHSPIPPTRDTWVRLAGTRKAPAKPFRHDAASAVPYWPRPHWATDVPAKMLHGVGADFDQAVAAWWQAQHRPAVLEAWRQKRIRRGRRPLPRRYYAAPRFQSQYQCTSCGHRANADENAARVIEQRGTGTSPGTPERIGREAVEPATAAGVEPATNPPSTGERVTLMWTMSGHVLRATRPPSAQCPLANPERST